MRGTVAKRIRADLRKQNIPTTQEETDSEGTVKLSGYRRWYQQAKKQYLKIA